MAAAAGGDAVTVAPGAVAAGPEAVPGVTTSVAVTSPCTAFFAFALAVPLATRVAWRLAAATALSSAVFADFVPDPASVQREGPAYRYPQSGWIVVHVEGQPYDPPSRSMAMLG